MFKSKIYKTGVYVKHVLVQYPGFAWVTLSYFIKLFCMIMKQKRKTLDLKMAEFSNALHRAELFFSAPEVSFIINARKVLAPHYAMAFYYQKIIDFMVKGKFHAIWEHEKNEHDTISAITSQARGESISGFDTSSSISVSTPPYHFKVNYHNWEYLRAIQNCGKPALFMSWHNAAFYLIPYALCEVVPHLEVFTYAEFRYIDKPSIPMRDSAAVSLLKMAKMLESNRPILHYFDGPLGKKDLRYILFGVDVFFARGTIQLLRDYTPLVIPITAYVTAEAAADLYIGNDLFAQKNLATLSDYQIFDSIMDYFINDLRTKDPTQFLMYYWLNAYTSKSQSI